MPAVGEAEGMEQFVDPHFGGSKEKGLVRRGGAVFQLFRTGNVLQSVNGENGRLARQLSFAVHMSEDGQEEIVGSDPQYLPAGMLLCGEEIEEVAHVVLVSPHVIRSGGRVEGVQDVYRQVQESLDVRSENLQQGRRDLAGGDKTYNGRFRHGGWALSQ